MRPRMRRGGGYDGAETGLKGLTMGRRGTMAHAARARSDRSLACVLLPGALMFARRAIHARGGLMDLRCHPTSARTALPKEGTDE